MRGLQCKELSWERWLLRAGPSSSLAQMQQLPGFKKKCTAFDPRASKLITMDSVNSASKLEK